MGGKSDKARQKEESTWWCIWIRQVLEAIFLGAIVALALTGLTAWAPFGKWLEQPGLDLSDRARVLLGFEPEVIGDSRPGTNFGPDFLFLDVDQESCEAYQQAPCGRPGSYPPEFLAEIVASVDATLNPAAIILDMLFPIGFATRKNAVCAFDAALLDRECAVLKTLSEVSVPLIVNPDVTISGGSKSGLLRPWARFPAMDDSSILFAQFIGLPSAEVGDAKLRKIRTFLDVYDRHDQDPGPPQPLPHAAVLTAAFAEAGDPSRCLAEIRAYLPATFPDAPRNVPAEGLEQLCGLDLTGGADRSVEIRFTVPGAAPPPGRARSASDGPYAGDGLVYTRFALSNFLIAGNSGTARPSASFDLTPGIADGSIVVIGSSEPAANDVYLTSIGMMTGPEVLINAARHIVLKGELTNPEKPTIWKKLVVKLSYVAVGSIIFVSIFMLVQGLLQAIPSRIFSMQSDPAKETSPDKKRSAQSTADYSKQIAGAASKVAQPPGTSTAHPSGDVDSVAKSSKPSDGGFVAFIFFLVTALIALATSLIVTCIFVFATILWLSNLINARVDVIMPIFAVAAESFIEQIAHLRERMFSKFK